MKTFRIAHIGLVALCLLGVLAYRGNAAAPPPTWVRVQLIWGTNDEHSPDPQHRAVDGDLAKRLDKSPFRWKHYFEVNSYELSVPLNEAKTGIKMSSHCTI